LRPGEGAWACVARTRCAPLCGVDVFIMCMLRALCCRPGVVAAGGHEWPPPQSLAGTPHSTPPPVRHSRTAAGRVHASTPAASRHSAVRHFQAEGGGVAEAGGPGGGGSPCGHCSAVVCVGALEPGKGCWWVCLVWVMLWKRHPIPRPHYARRTSSTFGFCFRAVCVCVVWNVACCAAAPRARALPIPSTPHRAALGDVLLFHTRLCPVWQLEVDVRGLLSTLAAGAPAEARADVEAVIASLGAAEVPAVLPLAGPAPVSGTRDLKPLCYHALGVYKCMCAVAVLVVVCSSGSSGVCLRLLYILRFDGPCRLPRPLAVPCAPVQALWPCWVA
jgi:hypothetical protein